MSTIPPKGPTHFQAITSQFRMAFDKASKFFSELVQAVSSLAQALFREIGLTHERKPGSMSPESERSLLNRVNKPTPGQYPRGAMMPKVEEGKKIYEQRLPSQLKEMASVLDDAVIIVAGEIQGAGLSSMMGFTDKPAKREISEVVKKMLDQAPLASQDTEKNRRAIEAVYRGFKVYIATADVKKALNENKQFERLEITNLKRFAESTDNPDGSINFDCLFDVSTEKRALFQELLKDLVVRKILDGSEDNATLEIISKKLAGILRDHLEQGVVGADPQIKQGKKPLKQASDLTEKALSPLLEVVQNRESFKKACDDFITLAIERMPQEDTPPETSDAQQLPLFHRYAVLTASEKVDDPLTEYFKANLAEFTDELRTVLLTFDDDTSKSTENLLNEHLSKVLTSKRHLALLLGVLQKEPPINDSNLSAPQIVAKLIAPSLISGILEKLNTFDAAGGIKQLIDDVAQRAGMHVRSVKAVSAHTSPSTALQAFQRSGLGCHDLIKHFSEEGVNDRKFIEHVDIFLGKIIDQTSAHFLSAGQKQEIFKILWEKREELKPLLGGAETAFIYDVTTKTLFTNDPAGEIAFTQVANHTVEYLLNEWRQTIIDKVREILFQYFDPVRLQTLIIEKVLPPLMTTLRTTALSALYLDNILKETESNEMGNRLLAYLNGEPEQKAELAKDVQKDLQKVADAWETKGLTIELDNILEAQAALLAKLSEFTVTDLQGLKAACIPKAEATGSIPPKLVAIYGGLTTQLLGLTTGMPTFILDRFSTTITGAILPPLNLIRDDTSPLAKIFSLVQQPLLDLFSQENIHNMLEKKPPDEGLIKDDLERKSRLLEGTKELAIFAKWMIDSKAPSYTKAVFPSQDRLNDWIYAVIDTLTNQPWKNGNLLLHILNAASQTKDVT